MLSDAHTTRIDEPLRTGDNGREQARKSVDVLSSQQRVTSWVSTQAPEAADNR